jgi:hypothetical protein
MSAEVDPAKKLVLEQLPESERDRRIADDPRATCVPRTYLVRRGGRVIGKLRYNAVGVLYATKLAAGITWREESVETALAWIASEPAYLKRAA